jgi:hypothetical protein
VLKDEWKQRGRKRRDARQSRKENDRGTSGSKLIFSVVHVFTPSFLGTSSPISGRMFFQPYELRLELVVSI